MSTNDIKCPFCNDSLKTKVDLGEYSYDEYDPCSHHYSSRDDMIDWGEEYFYMDYIPNIIHEYARNKKDLIEISKLTKDLKIDKIFKIDAGFNGYPTFNNAILESTNELALIKQEWDGGGPGLSGSMHHLFINDINKIEWIFEDFQTLYNRLKEFDLKNGNVYFELAEDAITCPYCTEIICDNENEIWNHCDHLYSGEDDIIEWNKEHEYMNTISMVLDCYLGSDELYHNIDNLLENLKIKEFLEIDCVSGNDYGLAQCMEDVGGDVFILSESWDADRPGGSGTYIYFFINDIKNIKWIFDEFKIFYNRLVEFDKKNEKYL
tara:strand:+ start:770 stop:1732 length:963 start_codon:yes stop_codon:yes gene_type:complete